MIDIYNILYIYVGEHDHGRMDPCANHIDGQMDPSCANRPM